MRCEALLWRENLNTYVVVEAEWSVSTGRGGGHWGNLKHGWRDKWGPSRQVPRLRAIACSGFSVPHKMAVVFYFSVKKHWGSRRWGGMLSFLACIFSSLNGNTPGAHARTDTTPWAASAQEGDLRVCGPWSCPAAQRSVMGMEKINKLQREQACLA